MGTFFENKIMRPIIDAGAFSKMAVVLDRDDQEICSIEAHVSSIFRPVVTTVLDHQWVNNHYTDSFDTAQMIEVLLTVIPTEHQGALETLMLDSISEDPYDAVIVERAGRFIKEMRMVALKYLGSRRKELKAHLGVTWAVQYPEKVFRLIDEQIKSVKWEESEVLQKCFQELVKI